MLRHEYDPPVGHDAGRREAAAAGSGRRLAVLVGALIVGWLQLEPGH